MLFRLAANRGLAGPLCGGMLAVFLAAPGGLAAESGVVTFPDHHNEPVPVLPECTCRYRGQNLSLGEHVCLMSENGPRWAECVREGNVTSWRPGSEGCTLSRRFDDRPGRRPVEAR
jgi:hypothetical protein